MQTVIPGTLTILSAYPDPPFDVMKDGRATGFDVELMRAVCGRLSLDLRPLTHSDEDFNGIFAALRDGKCDAVISGTTTTPERAAIARFSVVSTAGLRGLTAGIQKGNTSDIVARDLMAQGHIAGIRYYPYDGIGSALDDLEAGRIGLVIKLFPVISWLARGRQDLAVVMQVPTREKLGIAFAPERADLCTAVDTAIDELRKNRTFTRLQADWSGTEASL